MEARKQEPCNVIECIVSTLPPGMQCLRERAHDSNVDSSDTYIINRRRCCILKTVSKYIFPEGWVLASQVSVLWWWSFPVAKYWGFPQTTGIYLPFKISTASYWSISRTNEPPPPHPILISPFYILCCCLCQAGDHHSHQQDHRQCAQAESAQSCILHRRSHERPRVVRHWAGEDGEIKIKSTFCW